MYDANSSGELLFHHTVPEISFISRDETDTRAFGYVFDSAATTGHRFIGIKTKKEAMVIMSTIGQLFTINLKRRRNAEEASALASSTANDSKDPLANEPIYHSAYEHVNNSSAPTTDNYSLTNSIIAAPPNTTLNRSARKQRTTSGSSTDIVSGIPVLPVPPADHRRHHQHHHHIQQQGQVYPSISAQSSTGASTSLFNELDMFNPASFESAVTAPAIGTMNVEPMKQNNLQPPRQAPAPSTSSFEWANFDEDPHPIPKQIQQQPYLGGNTNNSLHQDDTLNTISSISDVNISNLSCTSSTLSAAKTLSSQNDSATLVAPNLSTKNHQKNGSSSTIASSNFDGIDPFSDVFGEDPFNTNSLAMQLGGGDLSASFQSAASNQSGYNQQSFQQPQVVMLPPPGASTSTGPLENKFGSLSLNKSTSSFRSDISATGSIGQQSNASISSADRYEMTRVSITFSINFFILFAVTQH